MNREEVLAKLALAGITLMSGSEIIKLTPTRATHIWQDYVPRRCVTLVTGEGGVGKSLTLQALALAVTKGESFLGKDTEKGPVLYLDLENDVELDLHPRFNKLSGGVESEAADLQVMLARHGLKLDSSESIRHIQQVIDIVKPVLVIVDPLVSTLTGDEDNAVYMRGILDTLSGLAKDNDIAVVVSHHPRKRGMFNDPGQMIRGSSDIRNAVSSHFAIRESDGVLSIIHDKCRSAAKQADLTYAIADSADGKQITVHTSTPKPRTTVAMANAQLLKGYLTSEYQATAKVIEALDGTLSTDAAKKAYKLLITMGEADSSKHGNWRLLNTIAEGVEG